MKPRPKRKQVRNQKLPEVEETVPAHKPSKTEVNNVKVVIERATHEKTSRPKKNTDSVQITTHEDDDNDVNIDVDSSNSENEKEEEDEYQLEDDKEDDDYEDETSDYNSASSDLIEHEKPYYGGRKKLPPRAAATQKIDYSENHYYHKFQDYFFTRTDDDDIEPKRKSLSTSTRKRKLYSDDDDYSNISSLSDSQGLRSNKRPRRKRLPNRESKEKRIDYSENTYYRQFDSAFNAKLWKDKLPDDEGDTNDENEINNKQDINKKGKDKKPVTVQKTKTSSNKSSRTSRNKIIQSQDEQMPDRENEE